MRNAFIVCYIQAITGVKFELDRDTSSLMLICSVLIVIMDGLKQYILSIQLQCMVSNSIFYLVIVHVSDNIFYLYSYSAWSQTVFSICIVIAHGLKQYFLSISSQCMVSDNIFNILYLYKINTASLKLYPVFLCVSSSTLCPVDPSF